MFKSGKKLICLLAVVCICLLAALIPGCNGEPEPRRPISMPYWNIRAMICRKSMTVLLRYATLRVHWTESACEPDIRFSREMKITTPEKLSKNILTDVRTNRWSYAFSVRPAIWDNTASKRSGLKTANWLCTYIVRMQSRTYPAAEFPFPKLWTAYI